MNLTNTPRSEVNNSSPAGATLTTGAPSGGGISRRQLLTRLGGAAVALQFANGRMARAAGAPTLTSGYIPILDCVPLVVAYAKGLFAEAGIKAEKPTLIRAWPALLEAFTSKQILLTHILLPEVIVLRYMRNVPVRTVGFNHTDVVAMLLAKGTPTVRDLGGKVVGCPTWWAPHTGIFQDVVRAAGLKPVAGKEQKDIAHDEVGFRVVAPPDMVQGLKSEALAGCTVSEPFGAAAEVLAGATLAKMSGDVWRDHPCCQSTLLADTLNRDRSWSEAVTTAIYRACLWAHKNREELAELLGSDGGGYFPTPKAVIQRALLKQDLPTYGPSGTGAIMHTDWNVYRVKFVPYPYPSAFQTTIDLMKRMVVDPSSALTPAVRSLSGKKIDHDLVDAELVQKAMAAVGGIASFGASSLERKEQYDVVLKPQSGK